MEHVERLLKAADIRILTTYDVLHQLERTTDEERRCVLITVLQQIAEVIPSETTMLNITRLNEGRLGNGKDAIRIRGESEDIIDALIAEAGRRADFFVSADIDQRKRALRALPLENILDFPRFLIEIRYPH